MKEQKQASRKFTKPFSACFHPLWVIPWSLSTGRESVSWAYAHDYLQPSPTRFTAPGCQLLLGTYQMERVVELIMPGQ